MQTILITGFEPYGGETINASWEAARALDGWRSGDLVARALMLPVAYDACVAEFADAVEHLKPDGVLLTGQAARRAVVSVERFAHSGASATQADNRGVVRGRAAEEERIRLKATISAAKIARAIRASGIPSRLSTNAGDYVCNHLYYGVLKHLGAVSPRTPAVFVHLPATPDQAPPRASWRRLATEDAVRALQAAAAALIA